MNKVIFALISCLSVSCFADNCDKPRDDFDGLYCMNKIYMKADEDLNASFKELKGLLKPDEKKVLISTQLKWIEDRNTSCSIKNEKGFWVNLGCVKDTTINRTNILNDRIRECKATGCQPSKL